MIWLTWRQFRVSALTVFGALGVVTVLLAVTGPRLSHEYADLLAGCGGAGCSGEVLDNFFFPRLAAFLGLILLVGVVPVAVGVFWGAPLISREFETGTQDLVWQQSVPRRRWLAVKLGLLGLAAVAAAGLAVAAVNWWSRPLDAIAAPGILSRLSPLVFNARGYAAIGCAAFALALGATAGLLIRRTVPAMAVTFAVFVAVQIVMPTTVRPHYATPLRVEAAITSTNIHGVDASGPDGAVRGLQVDFGPPGAWVLTNETVDASGRGVSLLPSWVADCDTPQAPEQEAAQRQCLQRLTAEGYRQAITYHPAERFWRFQAYETAIFAGLSLLLVGLCFLRMRPD